MSSNEQGKKIAIASGVAMQQSSRQKSDILLECSTYLQENGGRKTKLVATIIVKSENRFGNEH